MLLKSILHLPHYLILTEQIDYENDSAIGGMTPQTSTMSVNSSIYQFVEENGRTYHRYKEGSKFRAYTYTGPSKS